MLEVIIPILYNPIFNLGLMAFFIILSIGFYNHSLDWLMIYYGCAPESKKAEMPIARITEICWIGFFIIAMLFMISAITAHLDQKMIVGILHIIIVVLYILLHIKTFILCQGKKKKRARK